MFLVEAEANTSAGALWVIWVARVELAPKLNTIFVPGWAASNCLPNSVNEPVNDAAANTVICPVSAAADDPDAEADAADDVAAVDPDDEEPQPASTVEAAARTDRLIKNGRRTRTLPRSGGTRGVAGVITDTEQVDRLPDPEQCHSAIVSADA
jgi:hypothetical protein